MDNELTAADAPERGTSGGASAAPGMINRVVAERYEVLEAVGSGPLLQAFRARDRALNRIVAVKTLRPALAGQPGLVERLRAGLATVLSLNHPNITRVYDVGEDEGDGLLFVAEEFVRGIDLKERIRRVAPFSLTAATDVAIALAEALEFAHARGVVHGDLRPQNVLIGPESQIKMTGFGLAGAQSLLSDPDTLLRTIPYAAPDVSQGRTPTQSGDLYALGVVLFEMLTGDLPYPGDGPIQIALRHAQDPVPTPRTLNPGVPRALEGIVQKALGKRAGERYASASGLLADLRAVRDALRYGKSLSWSPQDRPSTPEAPASAPVDAAGASAAGAPPKRESADATVVMPTPPAAKSRPPRPAPVAAVGAAAAVATAAARPQPETREVRERNWLLPLNLLLLFLVLAGAAALGWMTVYFVTPPTEVVVPQLVGKTAEEARELAAQEKFALKVVDEQFRDKEPMGVIYQMNPSAGYRIRENKPVSVWVSKGPKLVEVPDVRDMSIEKALRLLRQSGLRMGERTSEFDPLVARGNVLRQNPEPGENRPRNSPVDLVLSKGEEPPPPPVEPEPEPVIPEPAPPQNGGAGGETGEGGGAGGEDRLRVFTIRYPVPNDAQQHRVRIDVTDKDGTRTVYDEVVEPGARVQHDVEAVGKSITIRLYDNDALRSEQTR